MNMGGGAAVADVSKRRFLDKFSKIDVDLSRL
jgi:hypothetical protein